MEQACRDRPGRTVQTIEVGVFLFLILPSMALSFLAIKQGGLPFPLVAVATILRDLSLVSLILYFIWRNGEPVAAIGWTRRKPAREVAIGVALFVPLFFAAAALAQFLVGQGFSSPKTPLPDLFSISGRWNLLLAALLVSIIAISEETIFRGYLIRRLAAVSRSRWAAVILSAAIFSIGHGYEGSAGVLTVGVLGLIFALVYLWRGSLIAPITMHFLQDFLAIVLLPLLSAK